MRKAKSLCFGHPFWKHGELLRSHAVYALVYKGKIVYIGRAGNVHQRVYMHKIDTMFDEVMCFTCEWFNSLHIFSKAWQMRRIEHLFIMVFNPPRNVDGGSREQTPEAKFADGIICRYARQALEELGYNVPSNDYKWSRGDPLE